MKILNTFNAALFVALVFKGIWDHNGRMLIGGIFCIVIWIAIWPDLNENPRRRRW